MKKQWQVLSSGSPVTGAGASTSVTLRRESDGYIFDFDDDTFKASGWVATTDLMTEVDAVILPGVYEWEQDHADWQDDLYQVFAVCTAVSPSVYATGETRIVDGDVVELAIVQDIYDLTHNSEGEVVPVVIPPPASSDSCTIYALCYNRIGDTPLTSVTAVAKIIRLPYYAAGKYHEGESVEGTYASGVCSWDIVQGAEVSVSIKEIGLMGRGIVPDSASADVYTFLEE